jgi:hypothetical protein
MDVVCPRVSIEFSTFQRVLYQLPEEGHSFVLFGQLRR